MQLIVVETNKPKRPEWIKGMLYNLDPTNFIEGYTLDHETFVLLKEEQNTNLMQYLESFLDTDERITYFAAEHFNQ